MTENPGPGPKDFRFRKPDDFPKDFRIRKPDDFHVHLRDGEMLRDIAGYTAALFGRALVMPNLTPAILTEADAEAYRSRILRAIEPFGFDFEPLMTIKLTARTTPEIIGSLRRTIAVKVYPEGVTTNSEDGVRDLSRVSGDVFRAMADKGIVLSVHAEEPSAFCLDREWRYLGRIERIAEEHPSLKMVIEHVTTCEAVGLVRDFGDNVAATITAHHLHATLDDVVGDKLRPHHFCKPIPKRPGDRAALRDAAIFGEKFFLGTDSAPHLRGAKECSEGCAGCFTAPIALGLCATAFEEEGKLESLGEFTSERGARFYGLQPNKGEVAILRRDHRVPKDCAGIVPFWAGKDLRWKAEAR